MLDHMLDHYRSQRLKAKREKEDWLATLRNWCRMADKFEARQAEGTYERGRGGTLQARRGGAEMPSEGPEREGEPTELGAVLRIIK